MFEKTLADLVRGIRAHKGQEVNFTLVCWPFAAQFFLLLINRLQCTVL